MSIAPTQRPPQQPPFVPVGPPATGPAWPNPTPNAGPYPGPTSPVSGPSARREPKRRGWLAMTAVALVAGLAASGVTVAVTNGADPAPIAPVTRLVQGSAANPDWTATAAVAGPSVVAIDVQSGRGAAEGSGVVIDAAGHVVTNHHVVAGGGQLTVTLSDRRVYSARVVATDPGTDLAVVQIVDPPAGLTPVVFGDVAQLKVGQPVMALGNPLGLSETVTTGIVSALDRPVVTSDAGQSPSGQAPSGQAASDQVVTNAIQTNAAINPGNSGGALVNVNGELIGITSSIATLGGGQAQSGNLGIGFAIPADQVKAVTGELIASGHANHAYLGVSSADARATLDGAGYVGAGVQQVATGTPAAAAGLRTGDVIIGIDAEPVTGAEGLIAQIRDRRPGAVVTLRVVRGGAEVGVPVTLAATPE